MANTIPFPAVGVTVAGAIASGTDMGSVDITFLGLSAPPQLAVFLSLAKNAAGDANITGSVLKASVTATSVPFELSAPTDNANRIPCILVIP